MMTEQKHKDQMEQAYAELIKKVSEMSSRIDPLLLAAIMMTQSLSIYKTALTPDEYNRLVENILEQKDMIREFRPQQENLH
jgi:hypothetical protein